MKFSYIIDKEKNLIYLKCKGKMSVGELVEPTNNIISDPLFKKGMNTIADLTEARIDTGYNEVKLFREYVKTIQDIRGPCKWAVITQKDLVYGIVRMFMAISEELIIKTQVFKNFEEAIKWVSS
jgi:hypothetical protein